MFKVILSDPSKLFFKKLDHPIKKRVFKKFQELEKNPQLGVPLTGNLTSLWKLRIGDYRAIYEVKNQELLIYILKLGHRKNVYPS
jgi:mRNA interferase RelE/StbE